MDVEGTGVCVCDDGFRNYRDLTDCTVNTEFCVGKHIFYSVCGYFSILFKSTDIDECGENRVAGGTPLCGEGMSCTNTQGSSVCVCDEGRLSADGMSCEPG